MNRAFLLFLFTIFLSIRPISAQLDLRFVLQEAFELPGNDVIDLAIRDVNLDGWDDFVYRDSTNLYIIDGINHWQLFQFPAPSGTSLLSIGDINHDSLLDVLFCGSSPETPDTNWFEVVLGPDYQQSRHQQITPWTGMYSEAIKSAFLGRILGREIICVGLAIFEGNSNWDRASGHMPIYEFVQDSLVWRIDIGFSGEVRQIESTMQDGNPYLILRTAGTESHHGPQWGESRSWAALYSIDSSYNVTTLWEVPYGNDFNTYGYIYSLYLGPPSPDSEEYIYINSHSSNPAGDSVVCIGAPTGNVIWQRSGYYCTFCTYYITLAGVLGLPYKDLLIFRYGWLDHLHIRNPYDGYLEEVGIFSGYRGNYVAVRDLENNGDDEFLFAGTDSLYVFAVEGSSAVEEEKEATGPLNIEISFYPNPFNSQSTCRLGLSVSCDVSIEIFDILGRRIATLVDNSLTPGPYEIRWNARDLSTGVYFAVARSHDFSKTMRLTLIK